jgi:hypothetical protein
VDRIVRIEVREANLYGLDVPSKMEVAAGLTGSPIDKEEMDIRLARLAQREWDTFMMVIAKMDGRWVEAPAIEGQGVTVEKVIAFEAEEARVRRQRCSEASTAQSSPEVRILLVWSLAGLQLTDVLHW